MVQCETEKDSVWGLVFPATVAGFSYSRQCPQNGTGTTLGIIIIPSDCMCVDVHVYIGTATRFCTLGGVWEAVNIDNCTSEVISLLNDRVRLCSYCSTLHYNEYMLSIYILILCMCISSKAYKEKRACNSLSTQCNHPTSCQRHILFSSGKRFLPTRNV